MNMDNDINMYDEITGRCINCGAYYRGKDNGVRTCLGCGAYIQT